MEVEVVAWVWVAVASSDAWGDEPDVTTGRVTATWVWMALASRACFALGRWARGAGVSCAWAAGSNEAKTEVAGLAEVTAWIAC